MRKGWEKSKLEEVCQLINGRAYKKKELLEVGKYPVLRVGNFFTNNHWYYSDLELQKDKYCDTGDLLYAWSASFGPRIWKGKKSIYHYHIWKIKPDYSRVTKDFLYHLLEWDKEKIKEKHGTGTTMMHVGKGSMEKRIVPIPPLPEQKQIVALLDQAFAAIDQAKANIEKNITNAKELFQSKLNEVFTNSGGGHDEPVEPWEEKKLGEVSFKIGSGSTPKGGQASYKDEGISLIRSMNVHDDGFRENNLAFIDDDQAQKLSNVEIQSDDLLLNITGASVARCCMVPELVLPARVNQHVSIIRVDQTIVNPLFLHYSLIAPENKKLLLGIGEQGSTRQAITKAQIEKFVIRYPEIEIQQSLIEQIELIKSRSEALVEVQLQKLSSLDELKKSLLQRAFSGELTKLSEAEFSELEDSQDLTIAAEPKAAYSRKLV